MGVGTDDRPHSPVKIPSHGLLLRCGFGVEVNADNPTRFPRIVEQRVDCPKRIIELAHEGSPDGVDDGNSLLAADSSSG